MIKTYAVYLAVATTLSGLAYASIDYAMNGPKIDALSINQKHTVKHTEFGLTHSWALRK